MNKFVKFCKSFYKNVIVMKKFRVFWALLTDKEFQARLNYLHELTKNCTKVELKELSVKDINFGHRIFYPHYALDLYIQGTPFGPIKVVADPNLGVGQWRVVDGNHRFQVIKYRGDKTIICKVMS